jgi:hypothetical protein
VHLLAGQVSYALNPLTLPQATLLLKSVSPKPQLDPQQALDIVHYYQRRQHVARRSHR